MDVFRFSFALRKIYFAAAFSCCLALLGFFFYPKEKSLSLPSFPKVEKKVPVYEFDRLFPEKRAFSFSFPDLRQELEGYFLPLRPDSQHNQWVGTLQKGKERRTLKEGETVYLTRRVLQERPCYAFSNEPTEIGIKVVSSGEKGLQVEVILDPCLASYLFSEKERESFSLPLHPEAFLGEGMQKPFFQEIQKAKWYGEDALQKVCCPKLAAKQRLQIVSATKGGYFCSFLPAEILIYREGAWRAVQEGESTEGFALMRVSSLTPKELGLEIWDEEGKYGKISLPAEEMIPFKGRFEETLSQIRQRTLRRIVCLCERERLDLSSGDWMMRLQGKWKVLSPEEKKSILAGDLCDAEIFLFEGIVRSQGSKFLHGYLFNAYRTLSEEIKIPFQGKKGKISNETAQTSPEQMKEQKQSQPPRGKSA